MIDPSFSANGGVNLRQESSGDLYKVYTALVAGSRKPSHITNHTTTQGNECCRTVMTHLQERIKYGVKIFQCFERLPIRQNNLIYLQVGKLPFQSIKIERCDRLVGDDHNLFAAYQTLQIDRFK